MNIKNFRRLRSALLDEENPVNFTMATWFEHNDDELDGNDAFEAAQAHSCGTVACLAGHAALIAWQSDDIELDNQKIEEVAREWLGLTHPEATLLFMGSWANRALHLISKEEAIEYLTRIIWRKYI